MSECRIDPIQAVIKETKKDNFPINKVNDVCYKVCSAFQNVDSPWDLKGSCKQLCNEAVVNLSQMDTGKGECSHPRPLPPVDWNQIPNFFPAVFQKVGDVGIALKECNKLCSNTAYPKECMDTARVQSYAVVCDGSSKNRITITKEGDEIKPNEREPESDEPIDEESEIEPARTVKKVKSDFEIFAIVCTAIAIAVIGALSIKWWREKKHEQ